MLTVNYDVFFSTCASDLGGPTFKWFLKVLRLTAHNHVSLHMSLIIRESFKLRDISNELSLKKFQMFMHILDNI